MFIHQALKSGPDSLFPNIMDALVKLLEVTVLYYTIFKALGGLECFLSLPGSKGFHNMQIQIFVQFLRITDKKI